MFFYVLVILATFEGLATADDFCKEGGLQKCHSKELHEAEVPGTQTELERQCWLLEEYLNCLEDYVQKCGIEEVHIIGFSEDHLQRVISTAHDVCRKDTALHQKIVENLVCIKNVLDTHNAVCGIRKTMEKLHDHISSVEKELGIGNETYDSDLWHSYSCLYETLDVACFVRRTSDSCGVEAEAAVLEIITGMGMIEQFCPEQYSEDVKNMLNVLELGMEEEYHLKRLLYKE